MSVEMTLPNLEIVEEANWDFKIYKIRNKKGCVNRSLFCFSN